jgi:hypothetical protein
VYLLVFHAYINEMHGSRSKIPNKNSRPYIHNVKFLALLGAPCICDISRLMVNITVIHKMVQEMTLVCNCEIPPVGIQVYWDMTLCYWVSGSLCVRGRKYLGHRGSLGEKSSDLRNNAVGTSYLADTSFTYHSVNET